ncbi:MAG: radical SAM protein, partial [Exilispira sp.]
MNKSISLYIHIPFCHKKCNYCDFYSISEKFLDNNLIKKYTESIVNELQFYKPLLKNYSIESIYFGGGTPNCIDNNILYDFLYKFFIELNKINPGNPKEISEITMEMNPQFVTKAQINIIKDFPVNRISLGVQALDNKSLDFLGRNATLYETEKSIDMILSFFNNVSLDFIIGLPEQNIKKILNKIIKYSKAYNSLKHLSFYILNIAEGTLLYHNLYYNLYINK